MPRPLLAALLLLVCAVLATAAGSVPPSTSPPGGLEPGRAPQFILLTHDDAITAQSYSLMREVVDGRASINGCPAAATMFSLVKDTDCELLHDMYAAGHEIADHTATHRSVKGMAQSDLQAEIVGARKSLAECGISEGAIQGFRAPFLETDAAVRAVLHGNNFLYESSLIEETTGHSVSKSMAQRLWPFDMGSGIPMNCAWFSDQTCSANESYPGMWQVPLWQLAALKGPYSMDPGSDGAAQVYDILKANLDASYGGNRAPMPVFIHTYGWLDNPAYREGLKRFADYALSLPDIYFVTMRQLIAWMQNPIPVDQLTPQALGCGNVGGAGPGGSPGSSTGGNSSSSSSPPPPVASAGTRPAAPPLRPSPAGQGAGCSYTAVSGDALFTIASEHGTTVEALLGLNPQIQPPGNTIMTGQKVQVC